VISKNGSSFVLVKLAQNYASAAAYCLNKSMTLVSLEAEADFNTISSGIKGEFKNTNVLVVTFNK